MPQRVNHPEEALAHIRPGEKIFIGSGAAVPGMLVQALANRAPRMQDHEILHGATFAAAPYIGPQLQDSFRHNALFISGNSRDAVNAGLADYTPVRANAIPKLIRSGRFDPLVSLIQVAPGPRPGVYSLGVSVDCVRAAVERSRLVIAQLNPRMPYVLGEAVVTDQDIDILFEAEEELPEPPEWPFSDLESVIAKHVASLVPDGATLQLGLGRLCEGLTRALMDKNDLGIHSDLLGDGILRLWKNGNVSNRFKAFDKWLSVGSYAYGSRELYEWLDNNPHIRMMGSDYVNDVRRIGQHKRMVAINTALQVDLGGQVATESLGMQFYTGIGGQIDFMRGAATAEEGLPILAMPSRSWDGSASRIVLQLEAGSGVVTTRGDVNYVVTEYGVADLFGKTIQERALNLIEIAHPDDRQELLDQAKEMKLVQKDQPLFSLDLWKQAHTTRYVTLKNGRSIYMRPIRPSDEKPLQNFFHSHSKETILRRYGFVKKSLHHHEAVERTCIQEHRNMAIVALEGGVCGRELKGVGRYTLTSELEAEVGLVVHEEYQGKGLGSAILELLIQLALADGIETFGMSILMTNTSMLRLFKRFFPQGKVHVEDDGTYWCVASLQVKPAAL
jgi:acyl-CoA hydrolase/GNAT superfamily N-acetyltransferase